MWITSETVQARQQDRLRDAAQHRLASRVRAGQASEGRQVGSGPRQVLGHAFLRVGLRMLETRRA